MKSVCILLLFLGFVIGSNAQDINTVAGNGSPGYSGDGGPGTSALLSAPYGIALDPSGNVYIADCLNHVIRKFTVSTEIITTIAGTGAENYSGDGGAATSATIDYPRGVATDASGNVYIADMANNCIRKVTVSTGIITTVAGNGTSGYTGNGGAATSAKLNFPWGVALDASGNIYIADTWNSAIRKVTVATGNISTIAGTGTAGFSGDGGAATSAQLNKPCSIAIDQSSGDIYISDTENYIIRKVTAATGIITTIAGVAGAGGSPANGDVAASTAMNQPYHIALDASDNVYIANYSLHVILKVTASTGLFSIIAGDFASPGYAGDGGPAVDASLSQPAGLAVDPSGSVIYVSDYGNNTLRRIGGSSLPIELISFTGHNTNTVNRLEWVTASELNSNCFTIERSTDGINFEALTTVKGAGNSSQKLNYNTTDEHPNVGINYYRLKQTDFDGKFQYSNIIALENTADKKTKISNIYPNPFTNNLNFEIYSPVKGNLHIQIVDEMGRILMDEFQIIFDGKSTINLSTDLFVAGVYSLKITEEQSGYHSITKLVKK